MLEVLKLQDNSESYTVHKICVQTDKKGGKMITPAAEQYIYVD